MVYQENATRVSPDFVVRIENPIESATSYEKAITIISESECIEGIADMQQIFQETFPNPDTVCVIPILRGGSRIGKELEESYSPGVINSVPMQMSYYDEYNERMEKPVCIKEPDIEKIISMKDIVFAEAVVDSQATIQEAMKHIKDQIDAYNAETGKHIPYPTFHTFALVSKVNGSTEIPNLVAMFAVHPSIWVHGWGCDNGQEGREKDCIEGMLAPNAMEIPQMPYFRRLFQR